MKYSTPLNSSEAKYLENGKLFPQFQLLFSASETLKVHYKKKKVLKSAYNSYQISSIKLLKYTLNRLLIFHFWGILFFFPRATTNIGLENLLEKLLNCFHSFN